MPGQGLESFVPMAQLYPNEAGDRWYSGKSSSENFAEARDYLAEYNAAKVGAWNVEFREGRQFAGIGGDDFVEPPGQRHRRLDEVEQDVGREAAGNPPDGPAQARRDPGHRDPDGARHPAAPGRGRTGAPVPESAWLRAHPVLPVVRLGRAVSAL